MNSRTSLLLVLVPLFLFGCDSSPVDPASNEIWPLSLGNRWIGKVSIFDQDENLISTELDTIEIVGSRAIDGVQWYEDREGVLRRNRADGCVLKIGMGIEGEYLFAKYPAVLRDTFMTDTFVEVDPSGTTGEDILAYIQVVSVDTLIVLPSGNYLCIAYQPMLLWPDGSGGPTFQKGWYQPGVGPVRLDEVRPASSSQDVQYTRWELIEARIR